MVNVATGNIHNNTPNNEIIENASNNHNNNFSYHSAPNLNIGYLDNGNHSFNSISHIHNQLARLSFSNSFINSLVNINSATSGSSFNDNLNNIDNFNLNEIILLLTGLIHHSKMNLKK